jgi:hypothetical protein
MLKMPDTKARFFSVKHSTKIQGAHYTPSVCYPLSSGLQAVIEELAAGDMARIYPEKVRFVTGVPYPVKKPEKSTAAVQPSSVSMPEAETGSAVKPGTKKPPASDYALSGKQNRGSRKGREFE